MVGTPSPDGTGKEPVILAPRRDSGLVHTQTDEAVGDTSKSATWGLDEATHRLERKDESGVRDELGPRPQIRKPEIYPGAVVHDASQVEGPTEGGFSAESLTPPGLEKTVSRAARKRGQASPDMRGVRETKSKLPTAPSSPRGGAAEDPSDRLPRRAKEVFDRLRKAGMKARAHVDADRNQTENGDYPRRRRDEAGARAFDEALMRLSAGDLGLALKHFKRLAKQMPESRRLAAFIEAIDFVRTSAKSADDTDDGGLQGSDARILENFEGVLEDAVAYGRCPACFSMIQANFDKCFACGFALTSGGRR
jgi:hypothetical protein